MLDQPVPNPLAKNPNVHTHKVFASVGLILIGVIVILGILAFIYRDQVADMFDTKTAEENTTTTKVSTTSAKPATSSATNDETKGWKIYTSTTFKYTIKYPPDWTEKVSSQETGVAGYILEQVNLNRLESEDANNGKPNVRVYGNFEGTLSSKGCVETIVTCKDFKIDGVKGVQATFISDKDLIDYNFLDTKKILIVTHNGGQKEVVDKVISTIKFQ